MPEDVFKYSVELDTQGLAAQLASVRDTVSQGLGQAARGVVGAGEVAGAAVNRLSSDLVAGQQMVAAAMPAQFMMTPSMGAAQSTLASAPGMPQGFFGDLKAALGFGQAPVGVFPGQMEAIARQRLQERVQMGVASGMSTLGTMGVGAAIGTAFAPGIGTVIGAGVGILGDVAMGPVLDSVNERMADRARVQNVFGFNKFNADQRAAMSDFMRQQSVKSLFTPEEFNTILPAATMGGFFRGVRRGDVGAFNDRFAQAQQALQEDMFTLQLSGPEGMMQAGAMRAGLRRLGIRDIGAQSQFFREARVITQEMAELGEFTDPVEVTQTLSQVGAMGAQFGVAPRLAAQSMANQAMMMNRLNLSGAVSGDDIALLGGSSIEAAQRLTGTMMQAQRRPLGRAMLFAFGQADPATGKATINRAALEGMLSGRMSMSDLSSRITQNIGTGQDGLSKMMTLMANQGQVQGELLPFQGQIMKSFTEDLINQSGLKMDAGTRQFMMQNLFGVGEAESRILAQGLPGAEADRKRLQEESVKLDADVKGAIKTAQDSIPQNFKEFGRSIVEGLSEPLDNISRKISEALVPPMEGARDSLKSIEQRIGGTGYRANSPVSVGPIAFSENADRWMRPDDPMSFQGFRSVSESRRFPTPMISRQMSVPRVHDMTRLVRPNETMAG